MNGKAVPTFGGKWRKLAGFAAKRRHICPPFPSIPAFLGIAEFDHGATISRQALTHRAPGVGSPRLGAARGKPGLASGAQGVPYPSVTRGRDKPGVGSDMPGLDAAKPGVASGVQGLTCPILTRGRDKLGAESDKLGVESDKLGVAHRNLGVRSNILGVADRA